MWWVWGWLRDTQVTFIITEFSDREIRLAYYSSTNYILVTHTATENINSKSAENDRFIKKKLLTIIIMPNHQDLLDIKESKTSLTDGLMANKTRWVGPIFCNFPLLNKFEFYTFWAISRAVCNKYIINLNIFHLIQSRYN